MGTFLFVIAVIAVIIIMKSSKNESAEEQEKASNYAVEIFVKIYVGGSIIYAILFNIFDMMKSMF